MKIKRYLIGLCGLLLAACGQQEIAHPWESGSNSGDLQLQLSTKGLMNRYVVTSKGTDVKTSEEQEIKTLHVFLFDQDGVYLKANEANRYQNYITGGRTVINIDREGWADKTKAEHATVIVVANVEDGTFLYEQTTQPPTNIPDRDSLLRFIYRPLEDRLVKDLPESGMPMFACINDVDLTSSNSEQSIDSPLQALMARVDVSLQLNSNYTDADGLLPSLTLTKCEVLNAPEGVRFVNEGDTTALSKIGKINYSWQPAVSTLYNRDGVAEASFYVFENVQLPSYEGYPEKEYPYPDSLSADGRQKYKPLLADTARALAFRFTGNYVTYNGGTYEATYTLYLGANHTDDFKVKRNHQYKNDITIKGIVGHNGNDIGAAGEYTLDARVNILEEGNDFYISILRERNHDAHFCVTPMDVYFFHEGNKPTVEVILGEVDENGTVTNVPDWIGMERIPAENMEAGTVPDATKQDATGQWTAGNGKRKYFTKSLVSDLKVANGGKVIVDSNRDRIYFYIDENLELKDREATVTLIYKENDTEKRRRTLTLGQTHLLPVRMDDGSIIYMEAYEEYLNHYDPLDKFGTEQIYDGLPWADAGTSLSSNSIPRLYANKAEAWGLVTATNPYAEPQNIYFDGHPYTAFILERMGQIDMKLNDTPVSAFQYCFNKNKRNNDGMVNVSYGFANVNDEYYVISNDTKWFLPGITQMEKALTEYYPTFEEFQNYFYWSASAGKKRETSIFGTSYPQDSRYARATKAMNPPEDIDNDGTVDYHAISDWDDDFTGHNGKRGKALRTEFLRIRAFRIDLK